MLVSNNRMTTREKILDAAGSIFAARGLKDTTIREIVQQAGVNQAAVNYHFRDKDTLYLECLRHGVQVAFDLYSLEGNPGPEASPEERLKRFMHNAVRRANHRSGWHGSLMTREMANPSAAFWNVMTEIVGRIQPYLDGILAEINPRLPERERWLCVHSISAQCNYFTKAEALLEAQRPDWSTLDKELRMDILAEHIWKFSLAAVGAMQ